MDDCIWMSICQLRCEAVKIQKVRRRHCQSRVSFSLTWSSLSLPPAPQPKLQAPPPRQVSEVFQGKLSTHKGSYQLKQDGGSYHSDSPEWQQSHSHFTLLRATFVLGCWRGHIWGVRWCVRMSTGAARIHTFLILKTTGERDLYFEPNIAKFPPWEVESSHLWG